MKTSSVIFFFLGFAFVCGTPCSDLFGTWRNQLGSNMTIVRIENNPYKITGQYNTSVESSKGAATISSPIAGIVKPLDDGSVIAFNVLWNKGASLTTWVGQCIVCDGEAKIYTTWVLRSLMTPKRKWMTTRINQDTFWRIDVPSGEEPLFQPPTAENSVDADVVGMWRATSGDAFNITSATLPGHLEGVHLNPEKDNEGLEQPVPMYGSIDGNATYIALAFTAAGPTKIKGWTGHIYNPQEGEKIVETSWLSHSFSDSCQNPRRFVQYGMDDFTKFYEDLAPGA